MYDQEINRRRTFAIISHPDAGKTTLTEKFLLYGGAINLAGTVKSIAEESQVQDSGALVRYVTIVCENPGGLTTNNTAIAVVGTVVSIEDAYFELETDEELTFTDGNGVEIEKLLVAEGAIVKKGTPLFLITEDTFNNILSTKKKSYLSAEEALTKAENNYDDAIDKYDEYFITAPIDGTVITKDAKVGDKIQKSTSSAKTLATLYDLSELWCNKLSCNSYYN